MGRIVFPGEIKIKDQKDCSASLMFSLCNLFMLTVKVPEPVRKRSLTHLVSEAA